MLCSVLTILEKMIITIEDYKNLYIYISQIIFNP